MQFELTTHNEYANPEDRRELVHGSRRFGLAMRERGLFRDLSEDPSRDISGDLIAGRDLAAQDRALASRICILQIIRGGHEEMFPAIRGAGATPDGPAQANLVEVVPMLEFGRQLEINESWQSWKVG